VTRFYFSPCLYEAEHFCRLIFPYHSILCRACARRFIATCERVGGLRLCQVVPACNFLWYGPVLGTAAPSLSFPCRKSCPYQNSILDHTTHSEVLYQLCFPGSQSCCCTVFVITSLELYRTNNTFPVKQKYYGYVIKDQVC
jgi:hypothetical protein